MGGAPRRGTLQSEQPALPPCRRKGNVGLSGMAIADITLLSGFHALRADLEKVQPPLQPPLRPQQPRATFIYPEC